MPTAIAQAMDRADRTINTLSSGRLRMSSMSLEAWKTMFEYGGVMLLFFTFVFAAGAVITTNRINRVQAAELREFRSRIETEQQKTALAQKEKAEAQLKLDQWLAKKVIARFAEPAEFEPLKRFHQNIRARVLYKEGDGEAFMYAQTILSMLSGIGWKVPKVSIPTRTHPAAGNEGNPIIGTYVLAKHRPHGAEAIKQLQLPVSERSLPSVLSGAVKGMLLENRSMPENDFVIVIGEYLRDWTP